MWAWVWAAAALAKPCQLDLQVVFLNADQVAARTAPVQALDRLTGGLASVALAGRLEAAAYELTRREVESALAERQLAGRAEVRPAGESGRATGWVWWDPTSGVREPSTHGAAQLEGRSMLVVHLDDVRDAAVRVGGASPVLVDVARALGVDVTERVYARIVYEKMQRPMADAGLQALVNTGRGVRCPPPAPRAP